jgi:hypothetical protein
MASWPSYGGLHFRPNTRRESFFVPEGKEAGISKYDQAQYHAKRLLIRVFESPINTMHLRETHDPYGLRRSCIFCVVGTAPVPVPVRRTETPIEVR